MSKSNFYMIQLHTVPNQLSTAPPSSMPQKMQLVKHIITGEGAQKNRASPIKKWKRKMKNKCFFPPLFFFLKCRFEDLKHAIVSRCLFYSVLLSYMAIRVTAEGDDRYMTCAKVCCFFFHFFFFKDVGDRSQAPRSLLVSLLHLTNDRNRVPFTRAVKKKRKKT